MTIEIELTQGKIALIDDEDWDLVSGYRWHACTTPRHNTWYAQAHTRRADGTWTKIKMHRLILGLTDPRVHTDHIDGDGLNNRRGNLRACSNSENQRNRGSQANNTSGFKGVSWDKETGKWAANIRVNGKQKRLGRHDTPEEAYQAYCDASIELHGEFANTGTISQEIIT